MCSHWSPILWTWKSLNIIILIYYKGPFCLEKNPATCINIMTDLNHHAWQKYSYQWVCYTLVYNDWPRRRSPRTVEDTRHSRWSWSAAGPWWPYSPGSSPYTDSSSWSPTPPVNTCNKSKDVWKIMDQFISFTFSYFNLVFGHTLYDCINGTGCCSYILIYIFFYS